MGRRPRRPIYVNPYDYCHCDHHGACPDVHAEDAGIPNDDIAAYRRWDINDRRGDLYHGLEWLLPDLDGLLSSYERDGEEYEPGIDFVTDLATDETYDARAFYEAYA